MSKTLYWEQSYELHPVNTNTGLPLDAPRRHCSYTDWLAGYVEVLLSACDRELDQIAVWAGANAFGLLSRHSHFRASRKYANVGRIRGVMTVLPALHDENLAIVCGKNYVNGQRRYAEPGYVKLVDTSLLKKT